MGEEVKIRIPSAQEIKVIVNDDEEVVRVAVTDTETLRIIVEEGLGHGTESSIANHRDVADLSPQDGDVLVYSLSEGKYESKQYEGLHTHSNKSVLDLVEEALTTSLKTSYDDAVIKAHSHSNKTVLDAIEEAFTIALKTKLDGIESGATGDQTGAEIKTSYEGEADTNAFTDALLNKLNGIEASAVALATVKADSDISDAITKKHLQNTDQYLDYGGGNQVTVTDAKDAVDKKHDHSNKAQLDLVTDGDHDVRTDNPHNILVDQLDWSSGYGKSDIEDAVNKKHSQNADTKLDYGGANEVSASSLKEHKIAFVIDGGGSAITTGAKCWIRIPFACIIQSWELTADQSGSIVIDVWKDSYANFPPTDADSICGGAEPSLSSQQKNQDSSPSGWTTSISKGDYLRINVDSVATVTYIVLILVVTIG